MLIPLHHVVQSYGVRPGPVLHVGAHLAEEADDYRRCGFGPVWWVEANPDLLPKLRARLDNYPGQYGIGAAVADRPRDVTLYVANNGQSSSILPLGTHAVEHPEVRYVGSVRLPATTVDDLWQRETIEQASFLNVDVQGAELDVLRGGERYLESVQAVYSEINDAELYEGCVLYPELDAWLSARGFRAVARRMTPHQWGDGLWVR